MCRASLDAATRSVRAAYSSLDSRHIRSASSRPSKPRMAARVCGTGAGRYLHERSYLLRSATGASPALSALQDQDTAVLKCCVADFLWTRPGGCSSPTAGSSSSNSNIFGGLRALETYREQQTIACSSRLRRPNAAAMARRPDHLDLSRERPFTPQPPKMSFHMDLPSPRTGEIPPALSPLDAFAMHSRILAKRFEEEAQNGRRISRLPPMAVAKEMANRPGYFRSTSGGDEGMMDGVPEVQEENSPIRPTTSAGLVGGDEKRRPISHYPEMGMASVRQSRDTAFPDIHEIPQPAVAKDYFGISMPRASSPEPVDSKFVSIEAPTPNVPSLTSSIDSVQSSHPRTLTSGSQRSQRSDRGLAPPLSPRYPKSPKSMQSIRSVRQDSGDDDASSYMGYAVSSARKLSGSSNMSRPHSPFSPFMPPMHRSPSMTSDYSVNSTPQPAPPRRQNFSRPMSSGGMSRPSMERPSFDSRPSFDTRPSQDLPLRDPSIASNSTRPSFNSNASSRQNSEDDMKTPYAKEVLATPGEPDDAGKDYFSASKDKSAATYTYAKYTLPRGRAPDRTSGGARTSWIHQQFTWDQPNGVSASPDIRAKKPTPQVVAPGITRAATSESHVPRQTDLPLRDTSVKSTPERITHNGLMMHSNHSESFAFQPPRRTASPAGSEKISGLRLSGNFTPGSSAIRSRSMDPRDRSPLHHSSESIVSESTDRTIRATPLHERASSTELTADEHLEIGIAMHSAGQLNKSTYHLRLAALQDLPTAMLLYALACRHGWGMRPSPEEGVKWLRKAIDSTGLGGADVEDTISSVTRKNSNLDPAAEAAERKKRKAQFALAIYELGISYMNGWGCTKDKPLAVRCYEIAGSWGDCDALAEAGFCYTQGMGVKKDLKKAASLYRKAADGGMSMAGNSWIYKAKYMDDASPKASMDKDRKSRPELPAELRDKDKDKDKPHGRARTRSIWGNISRGFSKGHRSAGADGLFTDEMYALESEAGEGFDSVGRLECRFVCMMDKDLSIICARHQACVRFVIVRRRPMAVGVVVTGGTAVGIARGPESSSSSSIDHGGAHGRQSG
nr:mitosis inhibitor nif1 [Quercus suber]